VSRAQAQLHSAPAYKNISKSGTYLAKGKVERSN